MKAIQFTTPLRRPVLCNPIRKRTMADVDFTPKPIPTRRQRKLHKAVEIASPKLFNFFG